MKNGFSIKTKVTVHRSKPFLGPGVIELLKLIDETGSVKLACRKMDLSYTKAWTIMNRAEEELGYELISRSQGGKAGGGAALTPKGLKLIEKYEELARKIGAYAEETFAEIFPEGL